MSNLSEFVIKDGYLKQYTGPGGDVVIPDGVTSIGNSAFSHCSSLTSITIPNSVTSIGSHAFYYRSSLTSITIPDSVTSIGNYAFDGCSSLTSITIPNSVTSIGNFAFHNCTILEGIWVNEDNPNYSSDTYGVLFNKEKTELIQAPGAIVEYVIPDSVTSIGNYAFLGCSSLRSITIPDSMTSIGDDSFDPSLQEIHISKATIAKIGMTNARKCLITWGVMRSYLQNEVAPAHDTLKRMIVSGINLKENRENFQSLFLEQDDVAAMAKLFDSLKKVTIEEIEGMIRLCNKQGKTALQAFLMDYMQKAYTPSQIQEDADIRIEKELGLRDKTLAEWRKEFAIKVAGDTAVIKKYKGSGETVCVPEKVGNYSVISIGEKAFARCETVRTVYISEGIQRLEWRIFYGSPNVKDIHIPASVTSMEKGCIEGKRKRIHAPAGSYAEAYAKENNIPFVAE